MDWELIDGVWHGPHAERFRAISGGQTFADVAGLIGPEESITQSFSDVVSPSFQFPSLSFPSLSDIGKFLYTPGTPAVKAGETAGTPAGGVLGELGQVAKSVLPVAQIGAGVGQLVFGAQGAGQLARQTKLAEEAGKRQAQIAGQAQTAAQPLSTFSTEELARAERGEIPAAMQANIDLWVQGARQKIQDYAARTGQGDSKQLRNWLDWIDQTAVAMKNSALEQEQALGLQAGGTAGSVLGAAAGAAGGAGTIAAGQQQSLEGLIAAANQQLAALTAGAS